MNPEAALTLLAEIGLVLTLALAVVLILRKPVRAVFGAGATYALWCLPPLTLMATSLPNPSPGFQLLIFSAASSESSAASPAIFTSSHPAWPEWLLAIWLAGVVVASGIAVVRQLQFRRSIGSIKPLPGSIWRSDGPLSGPVLIGLIRPRIVVPPDFSQRYSDRQQQMIIAHEQSHQRRGDPWANAVASLIQCLFWFHPLIWPAGRLFRTDQEIACDASVLKRYPDWPRSYAEALLATDSPSGPAACHWSSLHSMKERIIMIKHHQVSRIKHRTGLALITLLALGLSGLVWSEGPSAPSDAELMYFHVDLELRLDEGEHVYQHQFVLATSEGTEARMQTDLEAHGPLDFTLTFREPEPGMIDLSVGTHLDGEKLGAPRIVFTLDSPGALLQTEYYTLNVEASREPPETPERLQQGTQ